MRFAIFAVALYALLATGLMPEGATAASQHDNQARQEGARQEEISPQERMRRRFPQPVKVGDLIGLPVLDYDDRTIGRVRQVARTPGNDIVLVMDYGGGWFTRKRPVPVPIEAVVILARQINALDIGVEEFDKAATWTPAQGNEIPRDEIIQIGIGRR